MIIDAHAHLEPRMLGLDALLRKLDDAGIDRVALLPTMNDPLPETPERLLSVLRRLMRSNAGRPLAEVVHRTTLTPERDLKLSGRVYSIYARPDNASVAEAIEAHPERFLGWIFLNPRGNPAVLDELERWQAVRGMVGVKLHPHWHDYRVELAEPVLERCEALGLPLLVHLGFRRRGDYLAMASRHPRLTIIAAHAGFPHFDRLWHDVRDRDGFYVDLSSPYLDEALVRDAVATLGPRRCLFGTDAPYGFHAADGSYDYGRIKGWITRLPVSSAEQEAVLGGNFLELLDRAGRAP